MKKVVLITTALDYGRELSIFDYTTPVSPPLGILSLGSYLAANNVPVELIDVKMDFGFGLTETAEEAVAQRVSQYLCEQAEEIAWVGISQISNTANGVALARAIRTCLPDLPIIFGGYFPSCSYETLLKEYPFITAIVRGDGEMAVLEISRCLAEGHAFLSQQTPNLAWRDAGGIHTSSLQPVALDRLPIMDFRLLRHPTYYPHIDLATSRGCPYACNYCLEAAMRPYANYPTSWVAKQFEHLEKVVPNREISLFDPIFGIGKKRTEEINRLLSKYHFKYEIESRVDILTVDSIPALAKSGVEVIYLGVESASAETLVRMHKVSSIAKAEEYIRKSMEVLQACFANNITTAIGFMLGFPGDQEADLQKTLAYIKEVKQLYQQVSTAEGTQAGFVAYPSFTRIYAGSVLDKLLESDFPGTLCQPDPFIGSKSILRASPTVDTDMTGAYIQEISKQDAWTDLATQRIHKYMLFPMRSFLEEHPELTNKDGISMLNENCINQ